ncbi:hypothetical protein AAHB54_11375, partial [Bacillus cereus]
VYFVQLSGRPGCLTFREQNQSYVFSAFIVLYMPRETLSRFSCARQLLLIRLNSFTYYFQ